MDFKAHLSLVEMTCAQIGQMIKEAGKISFSSGYKATSVEEWLKHELAAMQHGREMVDSELHHLHTKFGPTPEWKHRWDKDGASVAKDLWLRRAHKTRFARLQNRLRRFFRKLLTPKR